MGAPSVGEVVLVPFPFSNLSQAKVRPAVALASAGRHDWILCQVTSTRYGDPAAVSLEDRDFSAGGLRTASVARPGKLFTANASLILRSIGTLNAATFERVLNAVVVILMPRSS